MPLSWLRRPLVLAALICVGALWALFASGSLPPRLPDELRGLLYEPVRAEVVPVSGFAPTRSGERVWLELRAVRPVRGDGAAGWSAPGRGLTVMGLFPSRDPETASLRPGCGARVEGRLYPPRRAAYPGDFDEAAFLSARGAALVLRGRVRGCASGEPLGAPLRAAASRVHRFVHRRLQQRLPPLEAAVLEGLLLGYKGALPPARSREIQDAGVMHLLVPSGAKVGVVLAVALGLGALCGLGRGARLAWAAAAAGFYTLVVGADAPYTRAWLGFTSFAAGWVLGRESGALQGLALAALVTLCVEPREVLSAGFRMAYAAVFFLGVWSLRPRPARRPRPWSFLLRSLGAGATVQAALWPTFGAYFGRGSIVGLAANLVLIPCAPPLMGAGLLAALVPESLGGPAAACAGFLARAFLRSCAFFASLPFCAVDLAPMSASAAAAWYLALFGVLAVSRPAAATLALSAAFLLAGVSPPPRRGFSALLLGGAGVRAALLRPGDGSAVLLDARAPPSLLRGVLRAEGLSRVDALWLRGGGLGRRPAEALSRTACVRRLREGETSRVGGTALAVGRGTGGELPELVFRRGDFELRLGADWARVRGARRVGWDYCIMVAPSGNASDRCVAERMLSLRRDGAVRVSHDGVELRVQTTKS